MLGQAFELGGQFDGSLGQPLLAIALLLVGGLGFLAKLFQAGFFGLDGARALVELKLMFGEPETAGAALLVEQCQLPMELALAAVEVTLPLLEMGRELQRLGAQLLAEIRLRLVCRSVGCFGLRFAGRAWFHSRRRVAGTHHVGLVDAGRRGGKLRVGGRRRLTSVLLMLGGMLRHRRVHTACERLAGAVKLLAIGKLYRRFLLSAEFPRQFSSSWQRGEWRAAGTGFRSQDANAKRCRCWQAGDSVLG